jgi:AcrR family transcriptional regulator
MALRPPKPPTTAARAPGIQLGEARARALLLEGAARVFAERGVRATAVEDLLVAAGVSRRTFYRLYASKEDVAAALYRLGTERLLAMCGQAVAEERDLARQLERCVDAHLANAREFGRLVFVLGGEAQRHESALHARRMEVHESLVALLSRAQRGRGRQVDPLLLRGLLLALEGVTRAVLQEGDEGRRVTPASLARARRVMLRMATATLAGEGPKVAPLPTVRRGGARSRGRSGGR